MLSFEIKKLLKNKTLLIMIAFSIASVLYVFNLSNQLGVNRTYRNLEGSTSTYPNKFMIYYNSIVEADEELEKDFRLHERTTADSLNVVSKNPNETIYLKSLSNVVETYSYLRDKYNLNSEQFEHIFKSRFDDNLFEWLRIDLEYSQKHNVSSSSQHISNSNSNALRAYVYNFSSLFGLFTIIFLIFIFSGTIADEYKSDTNNLLWMSPINKSKVLFSKILSNIIFSAIYFILLSGTFFIVFSIFGGYKFEGFNEIYRIFGNENVSQYEVAWKLILKLIVSYFSVSIFIISIVSFIGITTKDKMRTFAIALGFVIVGYVLESQIRSPFNPVFAMDYLQLIKGNISTKLEGGAISLFYEYSFGIKPYIYYFFVSVVFIMMTIFSSVKIRKSSNGRECKHSNTPFAFEINKIRRQKGFITVLVIGVIVIVSQIFLFVNENNYKKQVYYPFKYELNIQKNSAKFYGEMLNNLKLKLEQNTDESKKVELESQVQFYKELVENAKILENESINLRDSALSQNASSYYLSLDKFTDSAFGRDENRTRTINENLKLRFYTDYSYNETKEINKYLLENNIPYYDSSEIRVSIMDEFNTKENRVKDLKNQFPASNSAAQTLHFLMSNENLGLTIILIFAFCTLYGYSIEKENGNQIEFLFTQPIKKYSIYFRKFLAQQIILVKLILVLILIIIFLGTLLEGLGVFNYPVVKYLSLPVNTSIQEKYFEIVPLYKMILEFILLVISIAGFLNALSILVSGFSKKKLNVVATILVISIFGYLVSNSDIIGGLSKFSPFTYFNIWEVISGEIIITNKFETLSKILPYCIINISTIVVVLVNMLVIKLNARFGG